MPVGLSNLDLQSHLDGLKKSVIVKFELTAAALSNVYRFQKSNYQEHPPNYTEILDEL